MTPQLPGAVGLTALRVYEWEAPNGLAGGSPHVHLCCTEGYVVVGGVGRVQTITAAGFAETPLRPGDVVWFTPGTIHRAVNGGDLRLLAIMQNSGLPEAGDAVLTLPPEHLADPDAYARAVRITGPGGPSPQRALARRDLALAGFARLRERAEAGDGAALEEFYAAAAALVRPRLAGWRERWERGAAAASRRTGEQIDALAAGDHGHLRQAAVARMEQPPQTTLGMCGYLSPYDPAHLRRPHQS
ncbi:MAG TPA: cupin domain-containing protein [Pseudonocardia sp.]|mgnify:CR=1 FL=1|uniref:cupin domain-containing protein n=1 Tax=Pseudonocardia sp. TaxID=60912 RepID=UPI002B4AC820|nr:cupin domain-containing protein [Pseudonocardia sp.]HLU55648.1 cupin domain-containing protein [Pseudonocardia sp.]